MDLTYTFYAVSTISITLSALLGYIRGIWNSFCASIRYMWIIAFFVYAFNPLKDVTLSFVSNASLATLITFFMMGFISVISARVVSELVGSLHLFNDNTPSSKFTNRSLGILFGIGRGILFVTLFWAILDRVSPTSNNDVLHEHPIKFFGDIAEAIYKIIPSSWGADIILREIDEGIINLSPKSLKEVKNYDKKQKTTPLPLIKDDDDTTRPLPLNNNKKRDNKD